MVAARDAAVDPPKRPLERRVRSAHHVHRVADRAQRIAQLVRHRRGELADGGEPLLAQQLVLHGADFGGALGDAALQLLVDRPHLAMRGFGLLRRGQERGLVALARADVLDRALVIEQPAAGGADFAAGLGDPDHRTVAAPHLRFEPGHLSVLAHDADELRPARGIDIELAADIGEPPQQLLRARIAVDARQRRIGGEIAAVIGGLEHAPGAILENIAIEMRRLAVSEMHRVRCAAGPRQAYVKRRP